MGVAALLLSVTACGGGDASGSTPHSGTTLTDEQQVKVALLSEAAVKAGLGRGWRIHPEHPDDQETAPEAFSGSLATQRCKTVVTSGCAGLKLMGGAGYDGSDHSVVRLRLYVYGDKSSAKTGMHAVRRAALKGFDDDEYRAEEYPLDNPDDPGGQGDPDDDSYLSDLGDESESWGLRILTDTDTGGYPNWFSVETVVRFGAIVEEISYERDPSTSRAVARKLAVLQTKRLTQILNGATPER